MLAISIVLLDIRFISDTEEGFCLDGSTYQVHIHSEMDIFPLTVYEIIIGGLGINTFETTYASFPSLRDIALSGG